MKKVVKRALFLEKNEDGRESIGEIQTDGEIAFVSYGVPMHPVHPRYAMFNRRIFMKNNDGEFALISEVEMNSGLDLEFPHAKINPLIEKMFNFEDMDYLFENARDVFEEDGWASTALFEIFPTNVSIVVDVEPEKLKNIPLWKALYVDLDEGFRLAVSFGGVKGYEQTKKTFEGKVKEGLFFWGYGGGLITAQKLHSIANTPSDIV